MRTLIEIAVLAFLIAGTYLAFRSAEHVNQTSVVPARRLAQSDPPNYQNTPGPFIPPRQTNDLSRATAAQTSPLPAPETAEEASPSPAPEPNNTELMTTIVNLQNQLQELNTAFNAQQERLNRLMDMYESQNQQAQSGTGRDIAATENEIAVLRQRINTIRNNPLDYDLMVALPPLEKRLETAEQRLILLQRRHIRELQTSLE